MKNSIQLFKNDEMGDIRVLEKDGSLWFVAKDVCDMLGHTDTSMALRKLDEDEKLIQTFYVSGQNRQILSVNEPGLYSLILRSNKPNARKFKKWVTSEVLPSIRRTGEYVRDDIDIKPILDTNRIFKSNLQVAERIYPKKEAVILANRATEAETGYNILKGFGAMHLLEGSKATVLSVIELSKQTGIYKNNINPLLAQLGLQDHLITSNGFSVWRLTEKGRKFGMYLGEVYRKNRTAKTFPRKRIKWSPSVIPKLKEGVVMISA